MGAALLFGCLRCSVVQSGRQVLLGGQGSLLIHAELRLLSCWFMV